MKHLLTYFLLASIFTSVSAQETFPYPPTSEKEKRLFEFNEEAIHQGFSQAGWAHFTADSDIIVLLSLNKKGIIEKVVARQMVGRKQDVVELEAYAQHLVGIQLQAPEGETLKRQYAMGFLSRNKNIDYARVSQPFYEWIALVSEKTEIGLLPALCILKAVRNGCSGGRVYNYLPLEEVIKARQR